MSNVKRKQNPSSGDGAISAVLNACRVLPTESNEDYKSGLLALIQELGADTPLKVYLIENIHECILWIRRYRTQKHNAILKVVANSLLNRQPGRTAFDRTMSNDSKSDPVFQLLSLDPAASEIQALLEKSVTTLESLQAEALTLRSKELSSLDENIARQFKMLQNLQAEYERLENRKLKREYLQLQVENLRRDLNAIEQHQPQAATGEPQ
jgi:erythromycin esterase-like protein